jgi:hypothetical protein
MSKVIGKEQFGAEQNPPDSTDPTVQSPKMAVSNPVNPIQGRKRSLLICRLPRMAHTSETTAMTVRVLARKAKVCRFPK